MPNPPEKSKPIETWTPAEHAEHRRSGEEPVSADFKAYHNSVLEAGGLEPEYDVDELALEDMTVEEHLERIQGSR